MTRFAQGAVAALVLLVGAAFAWRVRVGVPASKPTVAEAPKAPAPAWAPDPVLADLAGAPAGSLALRWMDVLGRALQHPPSTPAQEELLRSEERELSQEMKKRLAADPARWSDLLEVISREDPRIGRKIVGQLKGGVEDSAEVVLIRALKEGRHREVRLSSLTLIGARKSKECLWALVTAAQEDADSGVRYQALSELAVRKDSAGSSSETATITDLLLVRARIEPDPAVRQYALRVTGQSTEAVTRTPPPPRKITRSN